MIIPFLPLPLKALVREESFQDSQSTLPVAKGTRIILNRKDFDRDIPIIVVGDSMVFGALAAKGELFTSLLENKTALQVMNLGVGSTGPCIYNKMIKFALGELPESSTPLIFYVLFGNDLLDGECNDLAAHYVWNDEYRKSAALQLRWFREWLFQHSVTYTVMKRAITFGNIRTDGSDYKAAAYQGDSLEFLFAPVSYWKSSLNLKDTRVMQGAERQLSRITEANEMVHYHGGKLVLVLMPFKEQIYPPLLFSDNDLNEVYDEAYDETYDFIINKAAVPVVDLRAVFREKAAGGKKLFWTLDGHLTPEGHLVVAEELEKYIDVGNQTLVNDGPRPL